MTVCNVDMWLNGVILTSVGSSLLMVSIILKSAMKTVQAEFRMKDKLDIASKLKTQSSAPEPEFQKTNIVDIESNIVKRHPFKPKSNLTF